MGPAGPDRPMTLPAGSDAASLAKLASGIRAAEASATAPLAFLTLSGSFNPVHAEHLQVLEVARDAITRLGTAVVGGFLALSDDDYVRGKLAGNAWPLARRRELCRLAVADSTWIDLSPWVESSSYRACEQLGRSIQADCRGLLAGRSVVGIECMGSDTVERILERLLAEWDSRSDPDSPPWYRGRRVCCLLRPGLDSAARIERIRTDLGPRALALGLRIILVDEAGAMPLRPVSSRAIRDAIDAGRWSELQAAGWLAPPVFERIRAIFG